LWFILLVAFVSTGLATGFTLVATPRYGASVYMVATGLALLAGLVLGVGTALLLEYVAPKVRRPLRLIQERPGPIILLVLVSVGLVTGWNLVAVPEAGASIFVLAAGLALLGGLALGAVAAFLLEYIDSGRRDRRRRQDRLDPASPDRQTSNKESSES
jgi:hypothetical protein